MSDNILSVQPLPEGLSLASNMVVARGINIAQLQYWLQMAGDENAPHFSPEQEPVSDGRAFQSKDGKLFYNPNVRIAQRVGASIPGPDVRFLKDAQGTVRLQFELEEAPLPGLPAGAEPFNVKIEQVLLQWVEQGLARQRLFAQPTLIGTDDPNDSSKSNFKIRVGADLKPDEVEPLYHALALPASQAILMVNFSFGYWRDDPVDVPVVNPPPPPVFHPKPGTVDPDPVIRIHKFPPNTVENGRVVMPFAAMNTSVTQLDPGLTSVTSVRAASLSSTTLGNAMPVRNVSDGTIETPILVKWDNSVFSKVNADQLTAIKDQAALRVTQPNWHTQQLNRSISFTFDEELDAINGPIYRAIKGGQGLTEAWTSTEFGLVRKANFPNTVYRLPDEIRLIFNGDMGTPYLIPVVYRDEKDNARIRVTLGAAIWHDPQQLVKLRDYLRVSSSGQLAAPSVVVGGYDSATLRFTSAFPEEIKILGSDPDSDQIEVDLAKGFQVTLDLSQEVYTFIANLIAGSAGTGLTGEVNVTLDTALTGGTPTGTPDKTVRKIPVRLTFQDLVGFRIDTQLDDSLVSPRQVQLINKTPVDLNLKDCILRLLQVDSNSVTPLDVYEATALTPAFPVDISAGAALQVEIRPKEDNPDLLWNAVQLELVDPCLKSDPKQVLDHIHEFSPQAQLSAPVNVEAPVFSQTPIPDQFRNLVGIRAKILRDGYAPEVVTLRPNKATTQITLQRTLKDILKDQGTILTYACQVQNIYIDHEGQWSVEKKQEGSDLFVYPNPIAND